MNVISTGFMEAQRLAIPSPVGVDTAVYRWAQFIMPIAPFLANTKSKDFMSQSLRKPRLSTSKENHITQFGRQTWN